jgi:hypothetical protein
MKTVKLLIFVSILSFVSQSCRKGGPWGIKGKGSNVTKEINVSDFDKIHVSIDADVYYTQDSIFKIEVTAQENILAVLETKVSNKSLKFDYRRNVWDHNQVKITVHAPTMNELSISGSGDITVQNPLTTKSLELSITGSGNINVPSLTATNLKAAISGNGDVVISGGKVSIQDLNISGFGKIDAEDLVAQISTAKISGSGDITIQVVESLKVTISGSGNISYRGNPSVDKNISGSGRLIQIK